MDLISNFISVGISAEYWPKYNIREGPSLEINSETDGGNHRITEDFDGSSCAATGDAKQAAATGSSRNISRSLSWVESLVLSKTAPVITWKIRKLQFHPKS